MDTAAPNPAKGEDEKRSAAETRPETAFGALNASELFWQPYRSMSRAFLQTHQNVSAYIDINRGLADELQAILRRAQDLMVEMADRTFRRMADSPGDHGGTRSKAELEDMYDFAIERVRVLGEATVAAQIRSLEALRDHARNTMNPAGKT